MCTDEMICCRKECYSTAIRNQNKHNIDKQKEWGEGRGLSDLMDGGRDISWMA